MRHIRTWAIPDPMQHAKRMIRSPWGGAMWKNKMQRKARRQQEAFFRALVAGALEREAAVVH